MVFVKGVDFPDELLDLLRSYGMPKHVTKFALSCDGPTEDIILQCSFYPSQPSDMTVRTTEKKQYRLVEVG